MRAFRKKYCEIPDRLQSEVSALEGHTQLDKIESLVEKLQKEQNRYLSRETHQQNSISALVDRIKSLEECVSKLQKTLQDQGCVITLQAQKLNYQEAELQQVRHTGKLSKDDTVKSFLHKQQHLQQTLAKQDEDVQKVKSSIQNVPQKKDMTELKRTQDQTREQLQQHQQLVKGMSSHLDELRAVVNNITGEVQGLKQTTSINSITSEQTSVTLQNRDCRRCGSSKVKHHERDCGARFKRCHSCFEVGHFARCCRNQRCGRCGSLDHQNSECGAVKTRMVCWLCNIPGHLSRMCKMRNRIIR